MELTATKINELRHKIRDDLDLNNIDIPKDIEIATMTLEAKLSTEFFPLNIYKYIKRSPTGIVAVAESKKLKEMMEIKAERDKIKKKNKNKDKDNQIAVRKFQRRRRHAKDKESDVFLNQVTISVYVSGKDGKPVSVKIFDNGSLHFTGCKTIDNMLEAVYKICEACRAEVGVFTKSGKIKRIGFAKDVNELTLDKLHGFKIDMINCKFEVPFKIDRPKFNVIANSDNYNSQFDSNGHAGVKIKYSNAPHKITVFVFESGKILFILGTQGFSKIKEVYETMYRYLLEQYDTIVKDDKLTESIILKHIAEMEKEEEKALVTQVAEEQEIIAQESIHLRNLQQSIKNKTKHNTLKTELVDINILERALLNEPLF